MNHILANRIIMKHSFHFGFVFLIFITLAFTVSAQIGIVAANAEQKPGFIVLGSYHFDNPGLDVAKSTVDDVLKPNRQKEIQQLITLLKKYNPSKIVVEIKTENQAKTRADYEKYVRGDYALGRNEAEQIGFRLAKILRHKTVYCVDWNKNPVGDISNYDYNEFAAKNPELKAFLQKNRENLQKSVAENDAKLLKLSIVEQFKFLNQQQNLDKSHGRYFDYVQIGLGDEYIGANYLSHWYGRNMKIFVNIVRITDSDDDKILVIYGAGHAHLLNQFAKESGYFNVESPLKYLKQARKINK